MVTRCNEKEITSSDHEAGAARNGPHVWKRTSTTHGKFLGPALRWQAMDRLISQVIAFAMYNLCRYPEYINLLQTEIMAMQSSSDEQKNYDNMPLMDSFLKETARLNPTVICKSNNGQELEDASLLSYMRFQ